MVQFPALEHEPEIIVPIRYEEAYQSVGSCLDFVAQIGETTNHRIEDRCPAAAEGIREAYFLEQEVRIFHDIEILGGAEEVEAQPEAEPVAQRKVLLQCVGRVQFVVDDNGNIVRGLFAEEVPPVRCGVVN